MQTIYLKRQPVWLSIVRSVLTLLLLWTVFQENLAAQDYKRMLFFGLFVLVVWVQPAFMYFFIPRYFISWDEQEIHILLPPQKQAAVFKRSQIDSLEYIPFTLKIKQGDQHFAYDLSPLPEKDLALLKNQLLPA